MRNKKRLNVKQEFENYKHDLAKALDSIDHKQIDMAAGAIWNASKIFVGGNGGSAAIANHLCCDISKGAKKPNKKIDTIPLMANMAMVSAIANDFGYEHTMSYQLDTGMNDVRDTLLLISSSGNSPNIVKAAQKARESGHAVIGFTGFRGGKLRELADICIHVNAHHYGIVEDCHQIVMHFIAKLIKEMPDVR